MASSFATGFALALALILAIGPQNAFILRQGLRREHVGSVVAFCAITDLILMAAGVAGLGAGLHEAPALTAALTLGGAAFLTVYGLGALRRALHPGTLTEAEAGPPMTRGAALARAAAFTLLNPHVYLDTVVLVGAVGAAQPLGTRGAFVAGGGCGSAVFLVMLGYGARLLSPLFARPAAWRILDAAVGITMLALAAGLARQAFAGF